MTPIEWSSLAELNAADLQGALLSLAEQSVEGKSGVKENDAVAALPEPVRVIWLLDWLDFEVTQGSLLAYLFNAHGRFAAEAVAALRLIGAHAMANILEEARASVDRVRDEWIGRQADTGAVAEFAIVHPYEGLSNGEELTRLTALYLEAAEEEGWGEKLDSFLSASVRTLAETEPGSE